LLKPLKLSVVTSLRKVGQQHHAAEPRAIAPTDHATVRNAHAAVRGLAPE